METKYEYSRIYLSLMNDVHKNNEELKISTITAIGITNTTKIELGILNEKIKDFINVNTKYSSNNKDFVITKRGKIKKTFFNQITLNYRDISTKSIKIFSNGKIQITGLTSIIESNIVFKNLCDWINECNATTTSLNDKLIEITDIKIGMINSNFNIKRGIDLQMVQNTLNNDDNFYSRYDPDSYPAINIKYKDILAISIFIFGSGNIVITGSKTLKDIQVVYNVINTLLKSSDTHYKDVKGKVKKNECIITYGYNLKQLLSAVV